MPATMEREIRLLDGVPEFVLAYVLRNESARALPFLVATHPLFALEGGSRLELPEEAALVALLLFALSASSGLRRQAGR